MIRISTGMIYDQGVRSINEQTAAFLKLQQQVSSGRRILTPADDPVNAARALVVNQSVDVVTQQGTNQDNAKSALGLEDAQLSSINDLLPRLKELAVQAGNSTLSKSDRTSIATELRSSFDQLLGIANSADGSGQYLFSGYMGSTKPFAGSVDALVPPSTADITYMGDDGQRSLQVSASRYLAVSDPGNDVFSRIKNGNGYFQTSYAAGNTGTGVIDAGNVTNPATWNALANKNYSIAFASDASTTPPTTKYDILDSAGNSLLTGGPGAAPIASQRLYQSGQPIVLSQTALPSATPPVPGFDLGASVIITGDPAAGDSFTLAPSTNQSIFKTLANLIGVLEGNVSGAAGMAKFSGDIGSALTNLDQAQENVLRVRTDVGTRLNEIDSLANANTNVKLQYQQTLSNLQDLDYAQAISDLTRKQTDLEAAQKSFSMTTKLSLFNYI